MSNYVEPITLRNANVLYKNFSGAEQTYNDKGNRNFCVELPENLALQMQEDGWNIKMTHPKDPEEEPRYYVQVAVAFRKRDGEPVLPKFRPKVYRVDSRKNVSLLSEDTIDELDEDDIVSVNVKIRGREHTPGKIKAYAKIVYATVDEDDPFASEYRYSSDAIDPDDFEDEPF